MKLAVFPWFSVNAKAKLGYSKDVTFKPGHSAAGGAPFIPVKTAQRGFEAKMAQLLGQTITQIFCDLWISAQLT